MVWGLLIGQCHFFLRTLSLVSFLRVVVSFLRSHCLPAALPFGKSEEATGWNKLSIPPAAPFKLPDSSCTYPPCSPSFLSHFADSSEHTVGPRTFLLLQIVTQQDNCKDFLAWTSNLVLSFPVKWEVVDCILFLSLVTIWLQRQQQKHFGLHWHQTTRQISQTSHTITFFISILS